MGYERIEKPDGMLFHYTEHKNLESIIKDGRIRKFKDRECWFCTSVENTLRLMEMTVMEEGKMYFDVKGIPRRYPAFVPEDYIIIGLQPRYQSGEWVRWNQELPQGADKELIELAKEFSRLKVGFRGDLKFYHNPEILEVSELIENISIEQQQNMEM